MNPDMRKNGVDLMTASAKDEFESNENLTHSFEDFIFILYWFPVCGIAR